VQGFPRLALRLPFDTSVAGVGPGIALWLLNDSPSGIIIIFNF
jgi:hypothetical protein